MFCFAAVCIKGYEVDENNPGSCIQCTAGVYKPDDGDGECLHCGLGKSSEAPFTGQYIRKLSGLDHLLNPPVGDRSKHASPPPVFFFLDFPSVLFEFFFFFLVSYDIKGKHPRKKILKQVVRSDFLWDFCSWYQQKRLCISDWFFFFFFCWCFLFVCLVFC